MQTAQDREPEESLLGSLWTEVSPAAGKRLRRSSQEGAASGLVLAACDILIILASGFLAYYLRPLLHAFGPMDMQRLPHLQLFGLLACFALLTVVCNVAYDLYSGTLLHADQGPFRKTLRSFALSSLLTITLIFLVNERTVPRLMVGFTVLFSLVGLLSFRYVARQRHRKRLERGMRTQHVLILGAGPIGEAFRQYLENRRRLGKVFCGFVNATETSSPYWLGTPQDLPRILKECFIDEIYCTPEVSRELIMDLAVQARQERVSVKVVPDLYGGLALGAGMTYIGNVPVLELNHQPIPTGGLFFKRLLDVTLASLLLTASSPLMLLTAVAIALDSPGPILYAAWRVGRKGRKFRCYKFRTMDADADARKDDLRHMNEREGATFKIANDPRITRVGRFLRTYSVDELPQLFNVLRGEMSMVGPRPHPVDDYGQYQLEDLRRLDVLPGITGLWQVSARRDPSFEKNVSLDLEYIENWNVWVDLRILLKTVPEVLRGSGH